MNQTQAAVGGRLAVLVSPAVLVATLLAGCGGSGGDPEPGTGRIVTGDQCFLAAFQLAPANPRDGRRAAPVCEPEDVPVTTDTTCPEDLNALDVEPELDIGFCSTEFVLGEVSAVEGDLQKVRLDILGWDAEGRRLLLSVLEIDLVEDIGGPTTDTDGILAAPVVYGPCDFTAGVDLDVECGYACAWQELSVNPCAGLEDLTATDVPVTCFEDDQSRCPDLSFGGGDSLTLEEIRVLRDENGQLRVLEDTPVAGEFTVTLRVAFEEDPGTPVDDTFAEMQVSGQFRARVAAAPFATVGPDDLSCEPADCDVP